MIQTNHFFNLGYGWLCKHCSAADTEAKHQHPETRASFFSHDDPEKKQANTSGLPLATWTDAFRHALTCPRCGIEETITNA
ncbi:MAG TPA: hypothetical protein VKC61_17315 [Pyrinomonadaceae bacterium]|jgi:hypothetical protein|nr:hypothetical protein [Pyrinomonadaceae bacterium]